MSTWWSLTLAAAVGVGAWFGWAVPWWLGVALVLLAFAVRKPIVLVLGALLLASWHSSTAWAALDAPLANEIDGVATITKDPEWSYGALRAEVDLQDRRYQLWARDDAAKALRDLSAGQRIVVSGRVGELSGLAEPSLRRKHVAGRITADHVALRDDGNMVARFTNGLRKLLVDGSQSLPDEQRSLLLGVVLGDDREQTQELQEDFEAANLTHLMAVSGANVAFVLILCAPLLRFFDFRGRFLGGVLVLFLFGAMTRWEPSVVRAEAMAAMVMVAVLLGRPVNLWRALGLGAAGAMLLDPFLVGSIGFLLSVSACIGMAALAKPIAEAMPGPKWCRLAFGYAAGAQIGVAPVQLAVFGPMPLVGIPANIVAEPLAAGLMMWGLAAGLAAGIAGEPVATVLHWPTYLLTTLLSKVAASANDAELGSWSTYSFTVVAVAVAVLGVSKYVSDRHRSAAPDDYFETT